MYIHTWNYHYNQDTMWVESKIWKLHILLSHPYEIPMLSSQVQQRFAEEGEQPPKRCRYTKGWHMNNVRQSSASCLLIKKCLSYNVTIIFVTMTKHNFFLFKKGPESIIHFYLLIACHPDKHIGTCTDGTCFILATT